MTKRTLQRKGYAIKHTAVGWWVDGVCGYMVSGYHPTEDLAVEARKRNYRMADIMAKVF